VRTPASAVDDVVPAARPITVFNLLSSRAGYGFPSAFTLPAVQRLFRCRGTAGSRRAPGTGRVDGVPGGQGRGFGAILLTQVAADSPTPPEWMRDFWRYAANAC